MVYAYSNNNKKEKLENNFSNQDVQKNNEIAVLIEKEKQKEIKENNIENNNKNIGGINIKDVKNKFDVLFLFEPKLVNIDAERKQLRDLIFRINKNNKKENCSILNKNNKFVITKVKNKNDSSQRKFKPDDIRKK